MKRLKLIGASFLIVLFCVAVYAQRINKHGGLVDVTSVGAITITPASGQGISLNGGTNIVGNTTTTGTLRVGSSGATLQKFLSNTASLDFGATAAGTCDVLTITVAGAAVGDTVALGLPHALVNADAYQSFYGWVSATNTVSVRRCNLTNSTTALSNPAAATVRATVIQF